MNEFSFAKKCIPDDKIYCPAVLEDFHYFLLLFSVTCKLLVVFMKCIE